MPGITAGAGKGEENEKPYFAELVFCDFTSRPAHSRIARICILKPNPKRTYLVFLLLPVALLPVLFWGLTQLQPSEQTATRQGDLWASLATHPHINKTYRNQRSIFTNATGTAWVGETLFFNEGQDNSTAEQKPKETCKVILPPELKKQIQSTHNNLLVVGWVTGGKKLSFELFRDGPLQFRGYDKASKHYLELSFDSHFQPESAFVGELHPDHSLLSNEKTETSQSTVCYKLAHVKS